MSTEAHRGRTKPGSGATVPIAGRSAMVVEMVTADMVRVRPSAVKTYLVRTEDLVPLRVAS